MNPPPRPPTIRRPIAEGKFTIPPPKTRRRPGLSGLFSSLAVHAVALAAACVIGVTATGGDHGDADSLAGGPAEPFQMSAPSRQVSGKATAAPVLSARKPPPVRVAAAELPGVESEWKPVSHALEIFPGAPGIAAWSGGEPQDSSGKGTPAKGKSSGAGKRGSPGKPAAGPRISPPHPISSPPPRYPHGAKSRGDSGSASILVRVRRDGSAASAEIYRSSGSGSLDQAAAAAVRRWKFSATPALPEGETIAVIVRVNFSL